MADDREFAKIELAKRDEEFEALLRRGVQQQELKRQLGKESTLSAKSH